MKIFWFKNIQSQLEWLCRFFNSKASSHYPQSQVNRRKDVIVVSEKPKVYPETTRKTTAASENSKGQTEARKTTTVSEKPKAQPETRKTTAASDNRNDLTSPSDVSVKAQESVKSQNGEVKGLNVWQYLRTCWFY